MPDAFAVTTQTTTITLDESRASVPVSFGIENLTGHLVRVRGFVAPGPETPLAWLPVRGESERDLPIGGRDEWIVDVIVPPEMPGGTYTFRFHAASVTLPDEEAGASDVVSIVVPAAPEPPPPPVPPEPPGYLETVTGALAGAGTVAAILLVIGFFVFLTANLTGGPVSGDTFGEVLGEIIAEAIGLLVALVVLVILFGGLGLWFGPPIGAAIVLRARGFRSPWRTALPMVVLIPLIGLPLLFGAGALSDAVDFPELLGLLVTVFAIAVGVTLAALAARAYARWRQTGGL